MVASEIPPVSFTVSVGAYTGYTIWEAKNMDESLLLWVGNQSRSDNSSSFWLSYQTHTDEANVSIDFLTTTLPPVGDTATLGTEGVDVRISNCGRGLYLFSAAINDDFARPEIPSR